MTTALYDASTALTSFYTSRTATRPARLWATEKLAQDLAAIGVINMFEGSGTDPTALTGYNSDYLWLQVSDGVTSSPGTLRAYVGSGSTSNIANWPALTPDQFKRHIAGGTVEYQGTWNASTNSPNLTSISRTKGDYYIVSTAGTTSLDGIATWAVGDWAVYNGSAWQKVDNNSQDDSFTQAGTGAVARTVQSKLRDIINVQDFGTITAGVDCSAVVQAALDAAKANGGGTVVLPPGDLTFTNYLTINGHSGVRVVGNSRTTRIRVKRNDSYCFVFASTASNYFSIENVQIIQEVSYTPAASWAIDVQVASSYITVRDVVAVNTYGAFRCIVASSNLVVEDCYFLNNIGIGSWLANTVNTAICNTSIVMTGTGSAQTGLLLDSLNDGALFTQMTCQGGDYGLRALNQYATYPSAQLFCERVVCDNNAVLCYDLTALDDARFVNCWAATALSSGSANGVSFGANAKGVAWLDGICIGARQSSMLLLAGCDNIDISNSQFLGWGIAAATTYPAIDVANASTSFKITGNRFFTNTNYNAFLSGAGLTSHEWKGVRVAAGTYRSYTIAHNQGVGLVSSCVDDGGSASALKFVAANVPDTDNLTKLLNGSAVTLANLTLTAPTSTSPVSTGTDDMQQAIKLSGAITPTALSGDVNDYAPTGFSTCSVIRQDGGAVNRNITGLAGGAAGRVVTIINIGATNTLVLKNASVSSTAANRFALNADITLATGQSAILWYDSTSSVWRCLGKS